MERFEQVLQDGYEFKFDQYLSRGWELFKKGAWSLIGFYFIVVVAVMVIVLFPL